MGVWVCGIDGVYFFEGVFLLSCLCVCVYAPTDPVPHFRRHPFLDHGFESVCVCVCVCVFHQFAVLF